MCYPVTRPGKKYMTTREIYSYGVESEILGTINGEKIAIINNNYEIIATERG